MPGLPALTGRFLLPERVSAAVALLETSPSHQTLDKAQQQALEWALAACAKSPVLVGKNPHLLCAVKQQNEEPLRRVVALAISCVPTSFESDDSMRVKLYKLLGHMLGDCYGCALAHTDAKLELFRLLDRSKLKADIPDLDEALRIAAVERLKLAWDTQNDKLASHTLSALLVDTCLAKEFVSVLTKSDTLDSVLYTAQGELDRVDHTPPPTGGLLVIAAGDDYDASEWATDHLASATDVQEDEYFGSGLKETLNNWLAHGSFDGQAERTAAFEDPAIWHVVASLIGKLPREAFKLRSGQVVHNLIRHLTIMSVSASIHVLEALDDALRIYGDRIWFLCGDQGRESVVKAVASGGAFHAEVITRDDTQRSARILTSLLKLYDNLAPSAFLRAFRATTVFLCESFSDATNSVKARASAMSELVSILSQALVCATPQEHIDGRAGWRNIDRANSALEAPLRAILAFSIAVSEDENIEDSLLPIFSLAVAGEENPLWRETRVKSRAFCGELIASEGYRVLVKANPKTTTFVELDSTLWRLLKEVTETSVAFSRRAAVSILKHAALVSHLELVDEDSYIATMHATMSALLSDVAAVEVSSKLEDSGAQVLICAALSPVQALHAAALPFGATTASLQSFASDHPVGTQLGLATALDIFRRVATELPDARHNCARLFSEVATLSLVVFAELCKDTQRRDLLKELWGKLGAACALALNKTAHWSALDDDAPTEWLSHVFDCVNELVQQGMDVHIALNARSASKTSPSDGESERTSSSDDSSDESSSDSSRGSQDGDTKKGVTNRKSEVKGNAEDDEPMAVDRTVAMALKPCFAALVPLLRVPAVDLAATIKLVCSLLKLFTRVSTVLCQEVDRTILVPFNELKQVIVSAYRRGLNSLQLSTTQIYDMADALDAHDLTKSMRPYSRHRSPSPSPSPEPKPAKRGPGRPPGSKNKVQKSRSSSQSKRAVKKHESASGEDSPLHKSARKSAKTPKPRASSTKTTTKSRSSSSKGRGKSSRQSGDEQSSDEEEEARKPPAQNKAAPKKRAHDSSDEGAPRQQQQQQKKKKKKKKSSATTQAAAKAKPTKEIKKRKQDDSDEADEAQPPRKKQSAKGRKPQVKLRTSASTTDKDTGETAQQAAKRQPLTTWSSNRAAEERWASRTT